MLAARSLIVLAGYGKASTDARDNATAALAIDRTNLLAQLVKAEVTGAISAEDARATAAAHTDDWHAWRLVIRALPGSAEASQAQARLCALAPQTAPECVAPTEAVSEARP